MASFALYPQFEADRRHPQPTRASWSPAPSEQQESSIGARIGEEPRDDLPLRRAEWTVLVPLVMYIITTVTVTLAARACQIRSHRLKEIACACRPCTGAEQRFEGRTSASCQPPAEETKRCGQPVTVKPSEYLPRCGRPDRRTRPQLPEPGRSGRKSQLVPAVRVVTLPGVSLQPACPASGRTSAAPQRWRSRHHSTRPVEKAFRPPGSRFTRQELVRPARSSGHRRHPAGSRGEGGAHVVIPPVRKESCVEPRGHWYQAGIYCCVQRQEWTPPFLDESSC